MKETKTNALRILDSLKIGYERFDYEVKEFKSGVDTAKALNQDANILFKTIVTFFKKNYYVCVIPVNKEIDFKKAAKLIGVKTLELLDLKDLLNVTGYVRGGCSPIGMKKKYPVYLDETATLYDEIIISGGKIGLQIKIKTDDFIEVTTATVGDITC